VRAFDGAYDLVELDLERRSVAVLRVLDDEDHQEGDDRRRRVDHQLARRLKPKSGPQTSHSAMSATAPANAVG
jgi:hypothetical protein